jgi:hypothetical protein
MFPCKHELGTNLKGNINCAYRKISIIAAPPSLYLYGPPFYRCPHTSIALPSTAVLIPL